MRQCGSKHTTGICMFSNNMSGWGLGLFYGGDHLQPCGRTLKSIYSHHRGCRNNPIFSNLELCAACWCSAHFMCHHELWPTSVSHHFFSVNSSLCFAGRKHYQKIIIPIHRLVLQNFANRGYFPYILFFRYIASYFLQVGLLLMYVALFPSGN